MGTFSKRGYRKKKKLDGLITREEMRQSKSSTLIALKGRRTEQLTENSVIFGDVIKGSGVDIHISLFFRDKAPYNFDVRAWYDNNTIEMKEKISNLMLDVALGKRFQENNMSKFLEMDSGTRMLRCITSDVVDGEREDIIGYLFNIEYKRF